MKKSELEKEAIQMLKNDDKIFMEMIEYLDFDYSSMVTEGFRCYWMCNLII